MTTVRLACVGSSRESASFAYPTQLPAILISYFYLKNFEKFRERMFFRNWVLDSGAFSAHTSGSRIDLQAFIAKSKLLLATDKKLVEVYALDVIGDWRASLKNTETMWASGVPAIPCFHLGEPWDVLTSLARDYPKIAIRGAARLSVKMKTTFAKQCFSRVRPKKIHGFGYGALSFLDVLPFHSVDATSWEFSPAAFGRWLKFGDMPTRRCTNMRAEIVEYLAAEQKAKHVWRREMALLDAVDAL